MAGRLPQGRPLKRFVPIEAPPPRSRSAPMACPVWWDGVSHVVTRPVRLDHLRAVGPLKCGWTTWFTKYGGPTERKWSKRAGRVTTCETPSHHAGRAVGAERGGAPEPPRCPNRPAPGS